MKKMYIIGAGAIEKIETVRRLYGIPDTIEIIPIKDLEDMPIEDRLSSSIPCVSVNKISAPPILPEIPAYVSKPKTGHRRPYKFHP